MRKPKLRWDRYGATYPYAYLFDGEKEIATVENTSGTDWKATLLLGVFRGKNAEAAARRAVEAAIRKEEKCSKTK